MIFLTCWKWCWKKFISVFSIARDGLYQTTTQGFSQLCGPNDQHLWGEAAPLAWFGVWRWPLLLVSSRFGNTSATRRKILSIYAFPLHPASRTGTHHQIGCLPALWTQLPALGWERWVRFPLKWFWLIPCAFCLSHGNPSESNRSCPHVPLLRHCAEEASVATTLMRSSSQPSNGDIWVSCWCSTTIHSVHRKGSYVLYWPAWAGLASLCGWGVV